MIYNCQPNKGNTPFPLPDLPLSALECKVQGHSQKERRAEHTWTPAVIVLDDLARSYRIASVQVRDHRVTKTHDSQEREETGHPKVCWRRMAAKVEQRYSNSTNINRVFQLHSR